RDVRLSVGVDAFDVPYRLQHYSSHSFAVHGPTGPSIEFVAHPDGAASLAAYIADVVKPFHAEMDRLGNEFGTLTQRTLSVRWNAGMGGTEDDLALWRLEQAAERIVAEAQRLSPEEREALRQNREPLVFHFDGERFGVAADMKPLADARETLLDATRNQPRRRR